MTIKTNPLSPLLLLAPLSLLLALLACRFLPSQATGLQMHKSASDGSIHGSYRYSSELGGETVRFSVSPDGIADFRMEGAPEEQTLTIDLYSKENPGMSWQGTDLDGMGALSGEEQVLLDKLNNSELAHGISMIPLDAACQGDESPDPAQMAALLYPLQMRFKYQISDRAAVAAELLALSKCNFGSDDKTDVQHPSVIMMTPSNPVPVVFGYFPFDEVGAVETLTAQKGSRLACLKPETWPPFTTSDASFTSPGLHPAGSDPIEDEWGPCNAKCRGACGPDCTHDNCKFRIDERCEKNQDGDNSGFFSLVYVYDCGLHPACVEHDACYDECNRRHGCGSWAAAFCMHGMTLVSSPLEYFTDSYLSCDSATLLTENPADVKDWMRGYGPKTSSQIYEYHDKKFSYEYDPVTCPRKEDVDQPGTGTEETAPTQEGDAELTTYQGTGEWFSDRREGKIESITSEIILSIADDGTVTGTLKMHDVEITYHNTEHDCSGHWEHWIDGTISGRLEGGSGVITLTENLLAKNFTNCPDFTPGYEGSFPQLADIKLNGDTLTGITRPDPEDPDEVWGFTFSAEKQ